MKCPHCSIEHHPNTTITDIKEDKDGTWDLEKNICPACGKMTLKLNNVTLTGPSNPPRRKINSQDLIYPKNILKAKCPDGVPVEIAEDFNEASIVLNISPKASAALSRRCLQTILRDIAKVKSSDLSKEIDEILARKELPPYLADALDAVRHIGNFATHPIKSKTTGEIVPVETGEAEWLLEVLEELLTFYFVSPLLLAQRKEQLNKKLIEAGKIPIK
jgi:hypothetical protein